MREVIGIGYIYKITNKTNGKVYVGQTHRDIPTRWHEHQYYSFHKGQGFSILASAIRKYGIDAFEIEELEECDNNVLDEREQFWIKEFDSCNYGYNVSLGGGGWQKCSDDEILSLWNEGLSVKEIAGEIPLHPETIANRLKKIGISGSKIKDRGNACANKKKEKPVYQYDKEGNFIAEYPSLTKAQQSINGERIKFNGRYNHLLIHGFQWRQYKADKIDPISYTPKKRRGQRAKPPKPHYRKIAQFSLDGGFISTHDSIIEASRSTGIDADGIFHACKGTQRRAGEYQWRYLEEAEALDMKLQPIAFNATAIPVYQYTLDGEYVRSFDSIGQAAKQFGIKGSGGIKSVCDGRSRHSHGYRWSYEKVDKLPHIRKNRGNRPVAKFDDYGNIIKVYQTMTEAGKEHDRSTCSIQAVCDGKHNKCAGYKWKYYETV